MHCCGADECRFIQQWLGHDRWSGYLGSSGCSTPSWEVNLLWLWFSSELLTSSQMRLWVKFVPFFLSWLVVAPFRPQLFWDLNHSFDIFFSNPLYPIFGWMDRAKGKDSSYAPYIAILPDYVPTPIHLDSEVGYSKRKAEKIFTLSSSVMLHLTWWCVWGAGIEGGAMAAHGARARAGQKGYQGKLWATGPTTVGVGRLSRVR